MADGLGCVDVVTDGEAEEGVVLAVDVIHVRHVTRRLFCC